MKEQAEQIDNFSNIVSAIAQNANDITFPGYPYGLIEADRISRVQNEELDPVKIQLLSSVTGLGAWEELEAFMKTVDAHQVLDQM